MAREAQPPRSGVVSLPQGHCHGIPAKTVELQLDDELRIVALSNSIKTLLESKQLLCGLINGLLGRQVHYTLQC
jgi:hypothetical protein